MLSKDFVWLEGYLKVSDAISAFLHPCEKQILSDILKIINKLREVAKFAKCYGSNQQDPYRGTFRMSTDDAEGKQNKFLGQDFLNH